MTGTQGLIWLARRETLRVSKLWTQTVLAPVVSSMLFILVFGLSLGDRIRQTSGVDYEVFIVPGLIAMAMVQAAYANNASTIFQARSDRYVNDILSAPMHAWQMTLGFVIGGVMRALAIGTSLLVVSVVLVDAPVERPFALLAAATLALVAFAALGLVVGIYAQTWDHTTFINNIVILPLAFVGGTFYSVVRARLPLARALALQPGLLSRAGDALRLPRRERREHLAVAGRDRGARGAGLPVGPVALHDGAPAQGLTALERRVTSCRRCPRLVEWRERVAREKRAAFRDEDYWGRPLPGFGDPDASLYVLGLAPAAHGGNRTGRVFTGDASADFLFAALHRAGYANQAESVHRGDGLRLRGAWVTAAVRCAPPANKPLPAERDNCLPYAAEELELLPRARVVLCLGGFAWDAALRLWAPGTRPKPRFGHGAEHVAAGGRVLLGCYHPSQQNTFTGRLTPGMMDAVLARARELAG